MYLVKVPITKNEKLNKHYYHLAFKSPEMAGEIQCGQFVFVRITPGHDPLLRRPFSVGWVFKGEINIVYKVVGKGTILLAEKKVGEIIDVMGPLGKSFSFNDASDVLLVAGGIGIASLISLMKMCVQKNVKLIYGAKTKSEFIAQEFLTIPAENIVYATEDGSKGHKGLVTDAVKEYLDGQKRKKEKGKKDNEPYIYTCGPLPMIQAVVKLASLYTIEGEANLEERMACGVGACLGCAVETSQGVKMVCKDGPVFAFKELGS